MNWVRRFNDDHAHGQRKRGVSDESGAEVGIILAAMVFAETNDVGSLPRGENTRYDVGISFLRPDRLGIDQEGSQSSCAHEVSASLHSLNSARVEHVIEQTP